MIVPNLAENHYDSRRLERLVAKLEANAGYIIGFHGTSASRTAKILANGFESSAPLRGTFRDVPGVYFWDEECPQDAMIYGHYKAGQDGDAEFAVIQARLLRPTPDYVESRALWRAQPGDINLIAVSYYDFASKGLSRAVDLAGQELPSIDI